MTAAISALCAVAVLAAVPWVLTRDTTGHRPPRRRAVCPTCRKHHGLDGCEGRPPTPGRWWA